MTTIDVTKNVQPDISEYFGEFDNLVSNDEINFHFDQDVTIDDIVIDVDGTVSYEVILTYPASRRSLLVGSATNADFIMNHDTSSANLWYSVPAWTQLQISITSATSSPSLKVLAIGRGGMG